MLANKLDFDRSLMIEDSSGGIRFYYKRYLAVLAATLKFNELQKAGKWDAPFIPTIIDFAQIVTSRTMWYSNYRNFEKVSRYPQMIDWLNETENAVSDIELWGFECETYQWAHFDRFLKRDGKPLGDSEDESEEEKVQVKKKKTHKKVDAKDKGKAKAKAKAKEASSREETSESESESAQKSQKKGKEKAASQSGEESASVQKSRKKSGSRRR